MQRVWHHSWDKRLWALKTLQHKNMGKCIKRVGVANPKVMNSKTYYWIILLNYISYYYYTSLLVIINILHHFVILVSQEMPWRLQALVRCLSSRSFWETRVAKGKAAKGTCWRLILQLFACDIFAMAETSFGHKNPGALTQMAQGLVVGTCVSIRDLLMEKVFS